MKVTINGFVTCIKYSWEKHNRYSFSVYEPTDDDPYSVIVMPHSFEIEVPDNFSPVLGQVAALNAQKERLNKEFADSVMKINQQINSLLAIENQS